MITLLIFHHYIRLATGIFFNIYDTRTYILWHKHCARSCRAC